jgi:hypothetical protein
MIPLTSNEIHLKLPLDLSEISLPVPESRRDNKDLYDEYITVIETEPRRKSMVLKVLFKYKIICFILKLYSKQQNLKYPE